MKNILAIGLFLLLGGAAIAQTADQRKPNSGATFSIDRGAKGKFEVKCADSDNTRQCVDAVLTIIPQDQGPGVAYATTSIKCGNTVYQVSTGTGGGSCTGGGVQGGPHTNGSCSDGGNTAAADCTSGCGATSGAGSCLIK